MIAKRRSAILAVLGAGVLLTLTVVVSQSYDDAASTGSMASTASSSEDTRARRAGDQPEREIRAREVDPATRLEFDDREPTEWESLGRDGRIDRTEQQLEALAEQISASDDPEAQALLRDRALTVLSWARADYFANASDQARYEAHEHALESP